MATPQMPRKRKQALRELAKLMNKRHQMPFPINEPLLDCFDLVITPEEVEFLLQMGTESFTYEDAARLSKMPDESFRPFFETQLKKGLVWMEQEDDGGDRYQVAGIMLGWFEMILSDGQETPEQQEFARRLDRLFNSWGKMNFFPLRNLMNLRERRAKPRQTIIAYEKKDKGDGKTTIEIHETLRAPAATVYHPKSVLELIEKYGDENKIAVMHCFCRQQRKLTEDPCRLDFPAEACIAIGKYTKHVVDYGIGRYISKGEALETVQKLREKGAVHQAFHEEEDVDRTEIAICNCCWDCCGVFGSYNRGILPLHFKSYYLADISDPSLCEGCGTCEEHCPVQAIAVDGEKSRITAEKCIGCGQCEFQCPEDAISMVYKERDVMLPVKKRAEARI
jgi:ferredoxin